jgi:hypothetical protein
MSCQQFRKGAEQWAIGGTAYCGGGHRFSEILVPSFLLLILLDVMYSPQSIFTDKKLLGNLGSQG